MSKKHCVPLLAVLMLVLAILACGGDEPEKIGEVATSLPQTTPTPIPQPQEVAPAQAEPTPTQEPAPPPAQTSYQIGDVISIGDVVMAVLGWDVPPGDEFSKPEEGKQFVAIDVVLVNSGARAASVSSMLQMRLKDDTGQQYDYDFMASTAIGDSSPDGELAPGERVRGKVGFQVPKEAKGLTFVFDASVWGTGKVFVELGPNPITVEVPAGLPGEQAQQTFNVGDLVQLDKFAVAVNEVTNPPGDEYTKPDAGKKFVVVDVSVTNNDAGPAQISSVLQMKLKDSTGQVYDLDFLASTVSGGTTPDGELAPGETIRGQVGFHVPESAAGLVFVFDADVWGAGKVFVVLP
jgi:hypothetical protein